MRKFVPVPAVAPLTPHYRSLQLTSRRCCRTPSPVRPAVVSRGQLCEAPRQSITQSMKSALPAKSICFPLCPPFWNPDKSRVPQGRAARSNLVTRSQRWTEAVSCLWFGPRERIERIFLKRIVHREELNQVHFDGKLRGNARKSIIIIKSKHYRINLFI